MCVGRLATCWTPCGTCGTRPTCGWRSPPCSIPGRNEATTRSPPNAWIRDHLGADVPLHFSAFHPDYKMRNTADTADVTRARRIGRREGCGLPTPATSTTREGGSTRCPGRGSRSGSRPVAMCHLRVSLPTTAAAGGAAIGRPVSRRRPGRRPCSGTRAPAPTCPRGQRAILCRYSLHRCLDFLGSFRVVGEPGLRVSVKKCRQWCNAFR